MLGTGDAKMVLKHSVLKVATECREEIASSEIMEYKGDEDENVSCHFRECK